MTIDWWTLALQSVNFLILVWLLHRLLYRPILGVVRRRQAEIADHRAAAEALRDSLDKERSDLRAERKRLADERDRIFAEAREKAAEERERLVSEARQEAQGIREEARRRLKAERKEAELALKRKAIDLGVRVARRLLEDVASDRLQAHFLDRLDRHLRELEEERRNRLARAVRAEPAVRVLSARPLEEEAQERLEALLRQHLGVDPELRFESDASLIAGFEIHFADEILRDSLAQSLSRAERDLDSHLRREREEAVDEDSGEDDGAGTRSRQRA